MNTGAGGERTKQQHITLNKHNSWEPAGNNNTMLQLFKQPDICSTHFTEIRENMTNITHLVL